MQRELGKILGNQGHQAGIVRARRHLAEPHLVALDEQFDAEQPASAEGLGHCPGDPLGLGQGLRAHRLRLPGLVVVALDLAVTDRRAESGAVDVAHGEQSDLVVEIDEALDDHPALAGAPAFLGIVPGRLQVVGAFQDALALARRTHDRLHHAGVADALDATAVVLEGIGEVIGRGRQAEFLGSQPADTLAVHGQLRGAGGGHHGVAFGLQLDQGGGGDGLDLGHDVVRLLLLDHRAQGGAVEHADHVAAMRHLHGRRVAIAIDGDHFATQALQLDGDFLAQLAGATEKDAGRARRQGGTDTGHGRTSEMKENGIRFRRNR